MSMRALAAAAMMLFGAVYLKCTMPIFAREGIPVLQNMLDEGQVVLPMEAEWSWWVDWD